MTSPQQRSATRILSTTQLHWHNHPSPRLLLTASLPWHRQTRTEACHCKPATLKDGDTWWRYLAFSRAMSTRWSPGSRMRMITRRTLDWGRFDVDQWVLGMTEQHCYVMLHMLSVEIWDYGCIRSAFVLYTLGLGLLSLVTNKYEMDHASIFKYLLCSYC